MEHLYKIELEDDLKVEMQKLSGLLVCGFNSTELFSKKETLF